MFDPRRDQPTISFPLFDGMGHSLSHGYETKVEDEPGICSPPLWTRSPPKSPHQRRNYYKSLSPTSKTQAIERGQRELMEMVRSMPESSYELTLKDIVEQPKVDVGKDNKVREKILSKNNVQKREGVIRKVDKKGSSNNKIDSGGLYLKMVFPTSLGSKKNNKKECSANNNSSKVSPRPSISDGSSTKGLDKDWWKKSLSASGGESDSGVSSVKSGSMKSSGSSSSNSNSSRSNSRHEMSGADSCWPFIRRPKGLSQK